jgi:RNase H-like domain found in reverse transcriptase
LEAAAAVWGMDFFNEYLKGKHFILYTDHKPLEKLGHLHNKMLNRLQTALLEHDFVIKYKKGSDMLADYLSRLSGAKDAVDQSLRSFPSKPLRPSTARRDPPDATKLPGQ